jgi:putative sigma-54 modulation protein
MNTNSTVTISGHRINITPALQENIENMAQKLQSKCDNITNIHIILKIDAVHPHLQRAEAEVGLSGKKEAIFAKASSEDMYKSLHQLKNKLNKQIVKHKEKKRVDGNHNHSHTHHNYNYNFNSKKIGSVRTIDGT